MLKGKGRHAKLGVFLAVALSLLVLGAPAANAADPAPHGNRFSGAGSDVTFKVGTDVDAIYNESPGCLTVAVAPKVVPYAADATVGATEIVAVEAATAWREMSPHSLVPEVAVSGWKP